MHTTDPPFRPIRVRDGYLPIEDHGLIGDGETAALVGRDGTIDWLCVPQFDSDPLFCALLDARRGGHFRIRPRGAAESRQYYAGETGVLHTEIRADRGAIRITDALTLQEGADLSHYSTVARGELVRCVEALDGPVEVEIDVLPYERLNCTAEATSGGWLLRCATQDLELRLETDRALRGPRTTVRLGPGEALHLLLRWHAPGRRVDRTDFRRLVACTVDGWNRWRDAIDYDGPQAPLVRRSALTLKMLDHVENGAMVAAPTSSLPERIGGERNWDYRFSWIRDATFCVYALTRIRLHRESRDYLAWLLDAVARNGGTPRVFYTLDGHLAAAERVDTELEGYRGSAPVRWGNAAMNQTQNDVYGEVLDCAWLWFRHGGEIDDALWERLVPCIETARRDWDRPDHGIWEVRTAERPFTYSAALCQVAVERGARLAGLRGLEAEAKAWRADAERIRTTIRDHAWCEKLQSFAQHLRPDPAGAACDASLLALPLRRVIEADDPRMVATTRAVRERLGAGRGLLYRYHPAEAPDGLSGSEGAFLLCSFWLVDNLCLQGRIDEAMELYDTLCAHANPIGLLPEQIDPSDGTFLGNFPQALSHVGLITSGLGLSNVLAGRTPRAGPAGDRPL